MVRVAKLESAGAGFTHPLHHDRKVAYAMSLKPREEARKSKWQIYATALSFCANCLQMAELLLGNLHKGGIFSTVHPDQPWGPLPRPLAKASLGI